MLRRAVAAAVTSARLPRSAFQRASACRGLASSSKHARFGLGQDRAAAGANEGAQQRFAQSSLFWPWGSMASIVSAQELHGNLERYWTTTSIVSSVLASMSLSALVAIPGWGKLDRESLAENAFILDDIMPVQYVRPLVVGLVTAAFYMSTASLMCSTILLSGISWIPRRGAVWFVKANASFVRLPFVLLFGSLAAGGSAVIVGLQLISPAVTPIACVLGVLNGVLMIGLVGRMLVTTHGFRLALLSRRLAAAQRAGRRGRPRGSPEA